MKRNPLLDKIKISSSDILVMAICFGITILISFVYYNYGSVKTVMNTVVEIKDDGMMVATEKDGQPLRDFTVKVSIKSADKVEESTVHAFVDLRSKLVDGQYEAVTEEGVYDFPVVVEVNAAPALSEFNKFEYSPKTVKLKVEHKTEEWIKIVPTFSGELGVKGYQISDKTLTPDRIKISGGRSIVEKAKADTLTTEAIDLAQITNKYSQTTLEVTPNFSNLDSRLKVDVAPDAVFSLNIRLSPIQGMQNYNGVIVSFANLAENLEITNGTISVSVSLKGSEISLEKIDPTNISVIADCVSVKGAGTYEIPLSVIAPPGTSILDQPSSIRIWVKEIERTEEEGVELEKIDNMSASENESGTESENVGGGELENVEEKNVEKEEKFEEKIENELEEVQELELL